MGIICLRQSTNSGTTIPLAIMYLIGMGSYTAFDVAHILQIAREAVEHRVVAPDAAGDGGHIHRHSVGPMAAAGLPSRRNCRDVLTPPEQNPASLQRRLRLRPEILANLLLQVRV